MEMDMHFLRKLPIPQDIKAQFPVDAEIAAIKNARDEEMRAIFEGKDKRFLLIIGPCSADREDAVLEYTGRLAELQKKVEDRIFIIPRIYTNKPRTTGAGYKGLIHQPNPEEAPDMLEGLIKVRELHTRAIKETGLTCADEMLYPYNHRYLSDILSYIAIGARSVENQEHRLSASGMGIPVGMKNPTSGDLSVMMNGIVAAQSGHTFIYRGWEVQTDGNPYAHSILRGYVDRFGQSNPNYHYENIMRLYELYQKSDLRFPTVIIDCNHANSGKQYLQQVRIAKEIVHNVTVCEEFQGFVKGLMIESYLEDGCQHIGDGVYGKSITDPCLGWEKTEEMVFDLADRLSRL
ncbi:MAG: 3-deoxy-7-phosphoheptulonate synthase [Lachnospiraceae bacterium]|nr:3-deoxy-7-phosphoheptulonate synthase [Candidatus Equihabitans merdae]